MKLFLRIFVLLSVLTTSQCASKLTSSVSRNYASKQVAIDCSSQLKQVLRHQTAPTGNSIGDGIDALIDFALIRPYKYFFGEKKVITTENYQGTPLSRSLVDLAQRDELLIQTDPRLHQYGLLVPNGGLCASACTVNVLGGLIQSKTTNPIDFSEHTPELINGIVDSYQKFVAQENNNSEALSLLISLLNPKITDARYGAHNETILNGLKPHLELVGAKADTGLPIDEYSIESNFHVNNSVGVASVEILKGSGDSINGVHSRHAILVLDIDTASKEIVISDPNKPNSIYKKKYTLTSDGKIYFQSNLSYHQDRGSSFFKLYKYSTVYVNEH